MQSNYWALGCKKNSYFFDISDISGKKIGIFFHNFFFSPLLTDIPNSAVSLIMMPIVG